MNIGKAITALKNKDKVYRKGWNGRGMWLVMFDCNMYTLEGYSQLDFPPYIGFKTAQNTIVAWCPSQTDILADDWEILKEDN